MTEASTEAQGSMSRHLPTVTVVVPVYDDLDRLRLCLRQLERQDYSGVFDVVVVDNASRVDLRPGLPPEDPRFVLVREDRPGSYAARNAGLARATGELVAFTDADCRPRPDWLSRAVAALAGPDAPDAVGGRIHLVYRKGDRPVSGPELYESLNDFDQESDVRNHHFAATANLVTTRAVLDQVGPFDLSLKSGGDLEWGGRLHAAGGRLVYVDGAVVDHPSRSTWGDLTRKSARVGRGLAALTAGEGTAVDLRFYVSQARSVVRAAITTLREGRPSAPTAKVRYVTAFAWSRLVWCAVRVGARLAPKSVATVRE